MILQQKMVDRPYQLITKSIEKPKLSMSIPGAAFNLKLAMEQYKKGSLVERVKGYYEAKGFETPEFDKMSKLERMEALAHYRQQSKALATKLDANDYKANQKHANDVRIKQQKEAEAKRQATGNRRSDTGSEDGGNK
mgnify:CR=1 FL=1